jgi:hypothetical protein
MRENWFPPQPCHACAVPPQELRLPPRASAAGADRAAGVTGCFRCGPFVATTSSQPCMGFLSKWPANPKRSLERRLQHGRELPGSRAGRGPGGDPEALAGQRRTTGELVAPEGERFFDSGRRGCSSGSGTSWGPPCRTCGKRGGDHLNGEFHMRHAAPVRTYPATSRIPARRPSMIARSSAINWMACE